MYRTWSEMLRARFISFPKITPNNLWSKGTLIYCLILVFLWQCVDLKWMFVAFVYKTHSARNENLSPFLNTSIPLISGKMASETTFDHWKVVFLMSKSEKKWEKGAWSNETPPTPFYMSTRSQNSFQIEFSSRNGREISDSVFWND